MSFLRTDRDKTAHLLRRFGLGASEAEINFYLADGKYESAVDKLLNYERLDENFVFDLQKVVDEKGRLDIPGVVGWWGNRFLQTHRPLQEKMTLFWHNHFATSAEKVKVAPSMLAQNLTLRDHATGSFRSMLHAISKDPAMIFWLDNEFNQRGKPNENFAREVMELFTLGIGNYTEKDVQEAARAFTGWTLGRGAPDERTVGLRRPVFLFIEGRHDTGEKTLFGKSGKFSGEDVLDMLLDNPRTAVFLTQKLFNWFVFPDPTPTDIAPFAQGFYDSGYDIKKWLRAVMLSDEFLSDRAYRSIFKNPMDFLVSTARQLGYGELIKEGGSPNRLSNGLIRQLTGTSKSMGMFIFFPPDVSGWSIGPGWISSATMIERITWGDKLFGKNSALKFQSFGIFEQNPTPAGVVDKLLSIFDVSLPAAKRSRMVEAAEGFMKGGSLTPRNSNEVAAGVSRLIFATPEFQMC